MQEPAHFLHACQPLPGTGGRKGAAVGRGARNTLFTRTAGLGAATLPARLPLVNSTLSCGSGATFLTGEQCVAGTSQLLQLHSFVSTRWKCAQPNLQSHGRPPT